MRSKLSSVFGVVAAAAFLLTSGGSVNAATVGVTSVGGAWSSLEPLPPGVTGLNTANVSWGTVHSTSKSGKQSGYSFVGAAAGTIQTDTDFDLGTFTHNNFVINAGTSIERAGLSIGINLMIGNVSKLVTTAFSFNHWETMNYGESNGLCANGGGLKSGVNAAGCADRVTIADNADQQQSFEIDGFLYILNITGFTVAGQLFSEFWTMEDAANSAILKGRFTLVGPAGPIDPVNPVDPVDPPPSPVPLPAAGWLLLAALGALGAARARRKA